MDTDSPLQAALRYKSWANDELLGVLRSVDAAKMQTAEFRRALIVLEHTYIVDRIFAAHLESVPHRYPGVVSSEPPPLEPLSERIRASDQWYVDYVRRLDPAHLDEHIDFTFTDGALGRMSRAEILIHLSVHGAYHRGNIAQLLAQLSVAPSRDLFTRYLHELQPTERRRA